MYVRKRWHLPQDELAKKIIFSANQGGGLLILSSDGLWAQAGSFYFVKVNLWSESHEALLWI